MSNLIIPVKKIYFDQLKSGEKKFEYRIVKDFWSKRLIGRKYDAVIITLGYPKHGEADKTIAFKWNGSRIGTIAHVEFGPKPVEVFAIDCTERI